MKITNHQFWLIGMWVSMAIWGVSWSSAKVLARYGPPAQIACVRFIIVFIALGVLLKALKISFKIQAKGAIPLAMATVFMSAYSYVFFTGLLTGNSGAAGVLVTTMSPLFALAISIIFFKETAHKKQIIGVAIGLSALFFLLHLWSPEKNLFNSANMLFLFCAFLWAAMSKTSSIAGKYTHPLTYSFWLQGLSALPLMFAIDIGNTLTMFADADRLFYLNLTHFSLINSAGATTFYLIATTKIGAEKASGFMFLVPTGAIIASWFFLDESPHWYTLVGGALGVLAVMVLQKAPKKKTAL